MTIHYFDRDIAKLNRFWKQETTFSMRYMRKKVLTVRCWKSHALRMFVATLGKIPRFFWFFLPVESSSSSPVPSPLPILALLASPATVRREPRSPRAASVISPNSLQKKFNFFSFTSFLNENKYVDRRFFEIDWNKKMSINCQRNMLRWNISLD